MVYLVQGKARLCNGDVKTFQYSIEKDSRITTKSEYCEFYNFIEHDIEESFHNKVAFIQFDLFSLL